MYGNHPSQEDHLYYVSLSFPPSFPAAPGRWYSISSDVSLSVSRRPAFTSPSSKHHTPLRDVDVMTATYSGDGNNAYSHQTWRWHRPGRGRRRSIPRSDLRRRGAHTRTAATVIDERVRQGASRQSDVFGQRTAVIALVVRSVTTRDKTGVDTSCPAVRHRAVVAAASGERTW